MSYVFSRDLLTDPFLPDSDPILGGVLKTEPGFLDMPRVMHVHDDRLEILFLSEGEATHIIGNHTCKVKAGDLITYNAGVPHEEFIGATADLSAYAIIITGLRMKNLPPNTLFGEDQHPIIRTGPQMALIHSLVDQMNGKLASGRPSSIFYANSMAVTLLCYILDSLDGSPVKIREIETTNGLRIKAYLDSHFKDTVTLQALSRELYLNPSYISHVFKNYSGYSPMQYVTRRRIGEAQSLLIHTDLQLSEIALSVGYANSSMFSRAFKQLVGITPHQYRTEWQR